MNVPMSWLREYVDVTCDTHEFIERMTMTGSKVEAVERPGHELSGVVVGQILSVEKHPDADKLVITQIDVAGERPLQIVTGATNIVVGAYVPVALHGATLAGGVTIKTGKLRGQTSEGMLCSIEELGYSRQEYPEAPEDGIYLFMEPQPLGADVIPLLQLADEVVEYEITSNRPDCFSVTGIAQEAAATFQKPFRYPQIQVKATAGGDAASLVSVRIEAPELCPRYIARVVKNVRIAPSPLWMRHRLAAAGIRPINNIVDITNYVMLELGQPMHAFDIDGLDLAGGLRSIVVRKARDGEAFTTLDGVERVLDSGMLVIADEHKPVAIAGVMGGQNSKVTEGASAVLFESANFNGSNIRLTSKRLGLRTDASAKYEKGLDPNLALDAVNRAVQLVELLGCGEVVPGLVDNYPVQRVPQKVNYRVDKINALLGTSLTGADMTAYLALVGIEADNGVAVIPTNRPDVEGEADIAEEVARLYGYGNIPVRLASGTPTVGKKNRKQVLEDLVKDTLAGLGLFEGMTYSFESPKVFDRLRIAVDSPLRQVVAIRNPLGEDYSIMRTTMLGGMLQSLANNCNRRNPEARLFEVAKTYLPHSLPLTELPEEQNRLMIGVYGNTDFYDAKGYAEALMETLGLEQETEYEPLGPAENTCPWLHPGRAAVVKISGQTVGYVGQAHPFVLSAYGMENEVYLIDLWLDVLYEKANLARSYKPLPKFPAMQRDIAMLVRDEVTVKAIEGAIRERGGKLIESVALFDVYKGKQIGDGYKSVAFSIVFRAPDRTLQEDEVGAAMAKIMKNVEEKTGARLRTQ